ncbi:MAG TPA: glycosyltransferase, partial [Candidatus Saccharimonadia bacterium]|nr:glycosyltransferase [Candidatus Saccharimonadia bacterium]
LPPFAFERIARALAATDADVVSALTNSVPELSPFAEGASVERADPLAIDAGCWWHGARAVLPAMHASPDFAVWRASARAKLRERPAWRGSALPPEWTGAVLDHLYVGDAALPLRGPAPPDDPRHPPPAPPLAPLRARFAPIDAARPVLAALDPRPVVLHVVHGWGGGVEAFVRDLAEHDDAHVHVALVARGQYSRKRYGETLELLLPAAAFACIARYPLPRPIATTALHDDSYAAVLREIVERHAVDAVVVSSLIGHSLDALETGRPTSVVLHDYFPLWPVLHADFGDASSRFDRAGLDAALAAAGTALPFAAQPAEAWWALREAWLAALERAGARVVAPSESVRRNVARIEPRLAGGGRIAVIPHGFRPFALERPAWTPPPRARPRVLVLGRIGGGKGEALLAPLIERISAWADLYLLGPGANAEAFFGRRGVHVELDYERDRLPEAIARITPDVAVIAASVAETWSYTLTELQALGIPVVATRIGALAERIADGDDGWLADANPDALVAVIERVARDPAALAAMRERLLRHAPRPVEALVSDWRDALALPRHAAPRYAVTTLAPRDLEAAERAERSTRVAARERAQRETLAAQQRELVARADWAASLERLSRERTTWAQQLEAETQRLAAVARERHEAVEAGELARAELAHTIDAQSRAHDAERQAAARDRAALVRELEELRTTLDRIIASRSWRLTRPLRFAARTARALRTALRFRLRRLLELGKRGHRSLRMRGIGGTLARIARIARGVAPAADASVALDIPELPAADDAAPLPAVPGSDTPRVSIVIPVYNQFHHTRMCLAALAQHAGKLAFEAIVVDDRSSDETPERLAEIAGIRSVRNDENLGFIGACNAGAALARGEYLVFLNNDTAVQAGWLEALVATFSAFPDCGLAGAKLVYPDGRLQEAGGIVFSDGSGWNYGRGGDPADPAYGYVREADYCSGAAIMVRRALFEQLGGFDARYRPAYYEDTDFAFRVREAEFKAYYQPASVVVHFEGVTSGTDTGSGIKRYQLVNQEKFVERWKGALARQPKPGTPIEHAREHRVRGTVLIVDAYVPEPDQDSGSVRLVNLMKLLVAGGWKVVFAPDNRAYVPRYTAALQQLGVEVLYHPWYRDPIDWLARNGARLDAAIVLRHYVAVSYVPL